MSLVQVEIKDFGMLVKYVDERDYSDEQLLKHFKDCIVELWHTHKMEKVKRIIVSPKIFHVVRSSVSESSKGDNSEDTHTTFIPIELCDALEDTRVIFLRDEKDCTRFYTHKN